MLAFIGENLATILISAGLAALVALIVINAVRKRRKGHSGCACGCATCPYGGECNGE